MSPWGIYKNAFPSWGFCFFINPPLFAPIVDHLPSRHNVVATDHSTDHGGIGVRKTLTVDQAAEIFDMKRRSILDPRVRQRLGLPIVKCGKRVLFLEEDVERVLRRCREKSTG
jgi:hypothetical protein